jgi:hypothetical protein
MAHLLAGLIAAALAAPAAHQDGDAEAKIRELVRQLGSEDFGAREKADQELRRIGRPAIPELEKAVAAEDLEVRDRAAQILRAIRGESTRLEGQPEPPELPAASGLRVRMFMRVPGEEGYELELGDGAVRLKLEKTGETYEAKDVEEFRKKWPELYERYVKGAAGGIQIRRAPAEPAKRPRAPDFSREAEKELEQLRKMLDDLQKWLKELDETPDFRWFEDWSRDFDREMREMEEMRRRWARRFREEMERGTPAPGGEREEEGRLGFLMSPPDPQANRVAGIPVDEGVTILKVYPETPAARLGLREGDTLHKINGRVVLNALQARSEFSRALKGEELKAEILRAGRKEVLRSAVADLRD